MMINKQINKLLTWWARWRTWRRHRMLILNDAKGQGFSSDSEVVRRQLKEAYVNYRSKP